MYNDIIEQLKIVNIIKIDNNLNSKLKSILTKHPILVSQINQLTSFLDISTEMYERLVCIREGIHNKPTCININCDIQTSYNRVVRRFRDFCSVKCSNSDNSKQVSSIVTKRAIYGDQLECITNKAKLSCIEKYGVEHPMMLLDIKNTKRDTMLGLYGVEYALQSKTIQDSMKANNLRVYGVEHSLQRADVRQKIENTNLKNHGVKCTLQTPGSINKIIETNLSKYGATHHMKNESVIDKLKYNNLKKYNREHLKQQHISIRVLSALNTPRWLRMQHVGLSKPLVQIAEELGVDVTTVSNYAKKCNIGVKRFNMSWGHKEISELLDSYHIEHINNDREILNGLELDIVIPEHKLAIEYCGLYWHSEQKGRHKNYHKIKMDTANEAGFKLLTIFEDEWKDSCTPVLTKILMLCNRNYNLDILYARRTELVEVDNSTRKSFFAAYHVQGCGPSGKTIGLESCGILVACMTFIKNSEGIFSLSRYATRGNVVGGFSKLLKHFESTTNWKQIVSFADLRWSEGNLYHKNNFIVDKILPPDYYYSIDGINRYHKSNFRRGKLKNLLKDVDLSLSEREICNNNGVLRIWDCGKIRFIKNNNRV